MTAIYRDEEHVTQGYATGAVDYLTKPFDPNVLRSKVAALAELWARGERLRLREAQLFERERAALVAKERAAREEADTQRAIAYTREARLQALLLQTSVPVAVYRGREHVYELANGA